jgi:hypothetical protein
MEPKCQICNYPGVDMNCACPKCEWRNDDLLQIDDDNYYSINFDIKPEANNCYSVINRCSPAEYKKKLSII